MAAFTLRRIVAESMWPMLYACMLSCFSHVWLFVILWTVALWFLYPWGFSRQEYWSGLQCPSAGDLPNPGIQHTSLKSPTLAGRFFTTSATWEACIWPTKPKYLLYSLWGKKKKFVHPSFYSWCTVVLWVRVITIYAHFSWYVGAQDFLGYILKSRIVGSHSIPKLKFSR